MVKQNTKYTRKKRLTKKQKLDIANKLESTVNKVSKKGLFFKTKNKFGDWSIVDGRTKKVLLDNILLVESANIILRTLTTASIKQLQKLIPTYDVTLKQYHNPLQKHLTDIVFYKHTMKTTTDTILFYATEARVDISLMKLRHCREELHNKLEVNSLHGIHLVK